MEPPSSVSRGGADTYTSRGGTGEDEFDFAMLRKVIDFLTADIVTILYPEVGSVLDQAKGVGLIGPDLHAQFKPGIDPKSFARKFLEVAMGQCVMDHSKVRKFLDIFENTPSLEIISKRILEEMGKLEKGKIEEMSISARSDDFALPPQQCNTPRQLSERDSSHSLRSGKSIDFASGGIQEQSSPSLKGATIRNFPNVEESTEEGDISEGVSIAEPQEAFARGRQMYRNISDKAQMRMKSASTSYYQAREALSPEISSQKEVSDKLDMGIQVTEQYYGTFMTISEIKQREINELERKYDRDLQELKKKHEAMTEDDPKLDREKQEEDLKSQYSKDAMKFTKDGKLLAKQVNFSSETSSVEVLQVTIAYEKTINDLIKKHNEEILSLKDENTRLEKIISELKLQQKNQEVESLLTKLDKSERKREAERKRGEAERKRGEAD